MTYSCALWPKPDNGTGLAEAQESKYERLCRTLRLRPEDRLLEIGCGWGGFAQYAATRYGCRITAVTLSENQYVYAARRIQEAGLADRVTIELRDYRHIEGEYDKIASIEMLEAVGHRYLPVFAAACGRLLAPGGLLGLQFITCPDARYDALRSGVDFIQKHIFPGSLLLSPNRLNRLLQQNGHFLLHDHFDIAPHYARTLRAWRDQFEGNIEKVRALGFDDFFVRKWRYYLCYCEAAFTSRNISVVQTLHTRPNNPGLDDPPGGNDR